MKKTKRSIHHAVKVKNDVFVTIPLVKNQGEKMEKSDSTISDKDQIIMSLAIQLVGMKHLKLSLKTQ